MARARLRSAVDLTLAHGDKIQRVLYELVRPARYVTWEYFSRQRLVASGVLAARGRPASRVLDVGCGSGALSIGLSEGAGVDVVSIDILPARIEAVHARRSSRTPAATARMLVLQANAEALPFRGGSFDAVVATEGFTVAEVEALGTSVGLRLLLGYTYRIPLPDRMMEALTPRLLSRSMAALGTRPLPFGLQVYAEFARP